MKERFSLEDIVQATRGLLLNFNSIYSTNYVATHNVSTLTAKDIFFDSVTYDSRQVASGSLFVAMLGEATDGHLFINEAVQRGAVAVLVNRDWIQTQAQLPAVPVVAVDDTLDALQAVARWWRNRYPQMLAVGITGSVGKSSTKELIAAVLSQRYSTFKSPKNINDQQSLMPVLLQLQPGYERAVIEMGAGWTFGELTRLCKVVQPVIGVELGVSHSHIGRMKTLENIAQAKAELVQALPATGYAVLNGDDPRVKAMAALTPAKTLFFGTQPEYDLWADQVESLGLEGVAFSVHYQGQVRRLRVPFVGRHVVTNLLAAIAVGLLNDLSWDEIEQGLQTREAQVRLLVLAGPRGSTIIDDTYNASPVSTVAALDLLDDISSVSSQNQSSVGRKVAVLGDMLELGDYANEAHQIVGRRAAQVADWLLVAGELGRIIGETALAVGFDPQHLIFAKDKAELVVWLENRLRTGDYVLVKASRGARFDEVVAELTTTPKEEAVI